MCVLILSNSYFAPISQKHQKKKATILAQDMFGQFITIAITSLLGKRYLHKFIHIFFLHHMFLCSHP